MNFKKYQKDKIYFYGCLGLCIFVTGIFFFRGILPGTKAWVSLKKELSLKEMELKRRYDTARENEKLMEEIEKIEKNYTDLSKMLFSLKDISGAVKEIASVSQDLQIEFISLTPLPAKITRSSPEIAFSLWEASIAIRIKTSYAKLIDFMKRIENSAKFMRIEDFQIKKNPSNLLIHDAQMTLCVYSLQQEKPQ